MSPKWFCVLQFRTRSERVPNECSALYSGPFGVRLLCQITLVVSLRMTDRKRRAGPQYTRVQKFTGSTRLNAHSASNAKAAMLMSVLRPSTAGKCRPKRLSTSAQSAALWTRGHASTASCRGVGCWEGNAGSRQTLPPSSNAGKAATCSGQMAAALARPANHILRNAARAALVVLPAARENRVERA